MTNSLFTDKWVIVEGWELLHYVPTTVAHKFGENWEEIYNRLYTEVQLFQIPCNIFFVDPLPYHPATISFSNFFVDHVHPRKACDSFANRRAI
jgi:hypothetical protein